MKIEVTLPLSSIPPKGIDSALQYRVPFGKFKGKTLQAILDEDPTYLKWLNEVAEVKQEGLREAIDLVCETYNEEIEEASRERERQFREEY
jgi:hypothetical protein